MVRFASTQEMLAPSASMQAPHFGESASFKDSDIRVRAHNSLDSLLQGNKRFVAVRTLLKKYDSLKAVGLNHSLR
jgi:hypothetical protein